jgi:uncharacterized protein (TIRG00374 family)
LRVGKIVRAIVVVALIVWLCRQIDVNRFGHVLRTGNLPMLSWGVFFFFISCVAAEGLRFHLLIKAHVAGFFVSVRVLVESCFFYMFLPTNIGGDGYKVRYLAVNGNMGWNRAVVVVVLERVIGLIALLAAGCLYLLFCRSRIENSLIFSVSSAVLDSRIFHVSVCLALLALLGFLLVPAGKLRNKFMTSTKAWARSSLSILAEIPAAVYGQLLMVTILFHGLMILSLHFFMGWLNHTVLFSDLMFVLFFTSFASLLPVSPGAMGVKEGAMAVSLVIFGIPRTDAVVVAFLDRILQLVVAAVGGILFCFHKSKIEN